MEAKLDGLGELIQLRVREQSLTRDLSDATHLFYSTLLWTSRQPESNFRRYALGFMKAKFFQMPQASRLGQMFIDIDRQFGSPLESNGVNIERWVFESREKRMSDNRYQESGE
jgi:hypothetical protein